MTASRSEGSTTMPPSCRKALKDVQKTSTSHAGLWFDRYLTDQIQRNEKVDKIIGSPFVKLIKEVVEISEGVRKDPTHPYHAYFHRWKQALGASGATLYKAQTTGPLAIGLGNESVIETAITLHHTYGVPYISGSALKGLTARYVRDHGQGETSLWRKVRDKKTNVDKPSRAYINLFGDTTSAGYVTFHDALPDPTTVRLQQDIMTVHHQGYYQNGTDDNPPADWDSPNPVAFMSARGAFMLALSGPKQWVDFTFTVLERALLEDGVGAKTSSGYGRLKLDIAKGK